MTDWPSAGDYAKALQNPEKAFVSAPLQHARFTIDPTMRMPRPVPGSSAAVFKAEVDGRTEALRLFTRDAGASREQYAALTRHFAATGLTDCVAMATWEDDAIRVNGRTRPVVRMEWIEGRRLDSYVATLVQDGNRAALTALASNWRTLVKRMQDARFAHGDLQHGNVLLDGTGALRLVDFDSAWIPPFADRRRPPERGHPHYQRLGAGWDQHMDTFPALVIYLSLVAVAKGMPWQEFYEEAEKLLFEDVDFAAPGQTAVWKALRNVADKDIERLTERLQACCDKTWPAAEDLETVLIPKWWEPATAGPVPAPSPPSPLPPPPPVEEVPIRTLPAAPERQAGGKPWYESPLTPPPVTRPRPARKPSEKRLVPPSPAPAPAPTPVPTPAAPKRRTGRIVLNLGIAAAAAAITVAVTAGAIGGGSVLAGLLVGAILLGLLSPFQS